MKLIEVADDGSVQVHLNKQDQIIIERALLGEQLRGQTDADSFAGQHLDSINTLYIGFVSYVKMESVHGFQGENAWGACTKCGQLLGDQAHA